MVYRPEGVLNGATVSAAVSIVVNLRTTPRYTLLGRTYGFCRITCAPEVSPESHPLRCLPEESTVHSQSSLTGKAKHIDDKSKSAVHCDFVACNRLGSRLYEDVYCTRDMENCIREQFVPSADGSAQPARPAGHRSPTTLHIIYQRSGFVRLSSEFRR